MAEDVEGEGRGESAEGDGDEVAREEGEDFHGFDGGDEEEERSGVEKRGDSANGHGFGGGSVGGAGVILGAAAKSDGFNGEVAIRGGKGCSSCDRVRQFLRGNGHVGGDRTE